MDGFFLGQRLGDDGAVDYDPSDLTTHGVIVGMTGSGKTGLGIIYLEEAARRGIPSLVIDPKGDMTNLLLTFPDLAPKDFRPWIDEAAAAKDGRTADQEAEDEAQKWTRGLAGSGLSGDDIAAMRATTGMTIYTPGSDSGVPINVIGELSAPVLSWDDDAETMRDEIQGYVTGLLGLIDIDADPMASREHILLSNLIEHSWRAGSDVTLETLIGQVATPPLRKLGVFEIDTFYPEKDRMALAMRLNGLLASPAFAAWTSGASLDIESLLWSDGRPQAAIVYIAHLSDAERQFIVSTVLSRLVTWMRTQAGSSELRVMTYMDEVFGFVPPTAQPPAKKPILTILKQARAFGVGMILSTQNPVDLDYKAMSNAGTWCIGRLQTERDKARILEALASASGDADLDHLDTTISSLDKRQFILHNTRDPEPTEFSTRWAMSYLRGPMTRDEITRVTDESGYERATPDAVEPGAESSAKGAAHVTDPGRPEVAPDVDQVVLDAAAPWSADIGLVPDGDHYEAGVAMRVDMHFDDTRADVAVTEEWEAVCFPLPADPATADFVEVDHDERDFLPIPDEIRLLTPDADIGQTSYFTRLKAAAIRHLDRNEELELLRCRPLKVTSRPDETAEAFRTRVADLARDEADRELVELRERYEPRIRKARRAYESAVSRADTAAQEIDDARGDALVGMGLELLMGRKPKQRSTRAAENRLRSAESKVERARIAYEDLGIDMEDEISAIEAKWSEKAADVESFTIGLESDDITVRDIRIIWVRRPSEQASSGS